MQNPNDINAQYYDDIYQYVKGSSVTNSECLLITALINKKDGNILDIGAGTGRHTLELNKRGYKVYAIDSSQKMLARINTENDNIVILNQNIFDFLKINKTKFDICILMWNAFNEIVLTNKDALTLISKLKTHLSVDGKILINIDTVPSNRPYIPEFSTNITSKTRNITMNWKNIKYYPRTNTTISSEEIIINDEKLEKAYIKQRWWKYSEIRDFAKNSGYKVKKYDLKCNNELYIVLSV